MDEVKKLQSEIKRRLRETGKRQQDLAQMIFVEDHEEEDEEAAERFVETLKKHLSRPTTPPEKLRRYLEILLAANPRLENRPLSLASSYLDKTMLRRMTNLSTEINKVLDKKLSS
ncbi:MAG: hypothetical protein ACKVK5_15275 [Pseudomonadales bacterium]|tara:strand:- start:12391 stop:12735 length:345 start_codon:yes stop_codon:yes gene_type:complete